MKIFVFWFKFYLLKYVSKGPVDNKPTLVQIMALRRSGDMSLFETMMAKFDDAYMRHSDWVS